MTPKKGAPQAAPEKSSTDDFTERLTRDYAPAWRPEAGDVLIGRITAFESGFSNHPKSKGPYMIVVMRDESTGDEVSVHVFHAALRSQLQRLNPQVGNRLGIAYRGMRETATGDEYHDYRASIDQAGTARSYADASANLGARALGAQRDDGDDDDDDGDDGGLPF